MDGEVGVRHELNEGVESIVPVSLILTSFLYLIFSPSASFD